MWGMTWKFPQSRYKQGKNDVRDGSKGTTTSKNSYRTSLSFISRKLYVQHRKVSSYSEKSLYGHCWYRPPDSDPEIVERKKKKRVPDLSFEYGQAHSVAAMMLEIHQDKNGAEWASSKCPASAWEESLHKLESTYFLLWASAMQCMQPFPQFRSFRVVV